MHFRHIFLLAIEIRTENCENLKCRCPIIHDYRFILQLPLKTDIIQYITAIVNLLTKNVPSIYSDNVEDCRHMQFLICGYHSDIATLYII